MKSKLITTAAVAILAGCGHVEGQGLAAPSAPAITQAQAADTQEARQFIKERLEAEVLGYRVKVESLQLVTPPFDGEYVFVANTATTGNGPSGPVLTHDRIIGSVYLQPKKKFLIWKERSIFPPMPSPSPSAPAP